MISICAFLILETLPATASPGITARFYGMDGYNWVLYQVQWVFNSKACIVKNLYRTCTVDCESLNCNFQEENYC